MESPVGTACGSVWQSCADLRLLATLPSLRVRQHSSQSDATSQPVSLVANGPHLLRLEDGTETPGLGLLTLKPGRTVVTSPRGTILFAVIYEPKANRISAEPVKPAIDSDCAPAASVSLDESIEEASVCSVSRSSTVGSAVELQVNGLEVPLGGCELPPGSAIVCGRCLFLFCWPNHAKSVSALATSAPAKFLASKIEMATLRKENSDLRARTRDLIDAASQADSLSARISAALSTLENTLLQQQQQREQNHKLDNSQSNSKLKSAEQSAHTPPQLLVPPKPQSLVKHKQPSEAVCVRNGSNFKFTDGHKIEEDTPACAMLTSPPEVLPSSIVANFSLNKINLNRHLLANPSSGNAHFRHQFLLGVTADVSDQLIEALSGINRCCDRQWLSSRISDVLDEIEWATGHCDRNR